MDADDVLAAELEEAFNTDATPAQSSGLLRLPAEALLLVLRCLSALDLVACSAVCRELRAASAEPFLWRVLHRTRWPATADTVEHGGDWRALYFKTDQDDCQEAQGEQAFLHMHVARRSLSPQRERLSVGAEAAAAAAPGRADTSLAVSAERRRRGLGDGRSSHVCTDACGFTFVREVAVCLTSGNAHTCGDACLDQRSAGGETITACALTGRVRSHDYEEGDAVSDEEMYPGAANFMGRAYEAGYSAVNARELREAQGRFSFNAD